MKASLCFRADQHKYISNAFSKYLGAMKLFYRESGEGRPLVILHGLFGSSDNWYTVGKQFAETNRVFMVDQRNHGQSPHNDMFNYEVLTEDLMEFIQDHRLEKPVLLGHSLGGKTVMNFAVRYPEHLSQLVVVDIVPKFYPVHHDHILEGLTSMPLAQLTSRTEADIYLQPYISDASERQFLLKNLTRSTDGSFAWRVNLAAIDRHIEEVGEGLHFTGTWPGSALFILGARSSYFKSGDEQPIHQYFPAARMVTLDTGHWVQAEKPAEFISTVKQFLHEYGG